MSATIITRDVKDVALFSGREGVDWFVSDPSQFSPLRRCGVLLTLEQDGGVSAEVPQLPGVFSQGESESEALDNIREALNATLESYRADGVEPPWSSFTPSLQESQKLLWILVDASAA